MKKFILGLIVLLSGSMAHAGSIFCSGSVMGYDFVLHAKSAGHKVTGKINFEVSNGGKSVKKDTLKVTSSDVRAGQYIKFSGANADGSGTVEANFDGKQYVGSISAQTSMGSGSVDLVCSLTGAIVAADGTVWDQAE